MAFNPITLEYHETKQGNMQHQRDEDAKFRTKLRAKNIDMRANSNFNIQTGEERRGVQIPKETLQQYANSILIPRDYK